MTQALVGNGLSEQFKELLRRREPIETLVTNGESRRIWAKEERPSYQAEEVEKRIIEPQALENALAKEFLPPLIVRVLPATQDLTVDETTVYAKEVLLAGLRGQDTIEMLKEKLIKDGITDGPPRVFLPPHELRDEMKLGECYVQWTGFGLDNWPPKFVVKPELKGFELVVSVPAYDTTVWEQVKGQKKLKKYTTRRLILDLRPHDNVGVVKRIVEQRLGIAVAQQILSAEVAGDLFGAPGHHTYFVDLEDDAQTMQEYAIDRFGLGIYLRVNRFDENGDFDFDHAEFLEEDHHQDGCT
ncbi:unnamed protein product [Durusdinium trenchii]|uniref:Ubiquitin-like domain-containing protein n=1 Tax=Durusdinium trenchii TaxID=1381693 RepID=A0ABP0KZI1_9DINO